MPLMLLGSPVVSPLNEVRISSVSICLDDRHLTARKQELNGYLERVWRSRLILKVHLIAQKSARQCCCWECGVPLNTTFTGHEMISVNSLKRRQARKHDDRET